MITICLTHFRSLALANLAAALYSVRRQDLSHVSEIVVLDNNTDDPEAKIRGTVEPLGFSVPVRLISLKHGDPTRTQSWSTNMNVRQAATPWVFYTRSDYILDFEMIERFADAVHASPADWDAFLTGNCYHMQVDIGECEATAWRHVGAKLLRRLPGNEVDYTAIDSGVWMARRDSFERAGGFDERLSAWGHAQTLFQHRMHEVGVQFVRYADLLYYHPKHAAERDMAEAHRELRAIGVEPGDLWKRYEGANPY